MAFFLNRFVLLLILMHELDVAFSFLTTAPYEPTEGQATTKHATTEHATTKHATTETSTTFYSSTTQMHSLPGLSDLSDDCTYDGGPLEGLVLKHERGFGFDHSEDESQSVLCSMMAPKKDNCNETLSRLQDQTLLYKRSKEDKETISPINITSSEIVTGSDEDLLYTVRLTFTMSRHHEYHQIFCRAESDMLTVESAMDSVHEVKRKYNVEIVDEQLMGTINQPLKLNCTLTNRDERVSMDNIRWKSRKGVDNDWVPTQDPKIVVGNSSIITVLKSNEWAGEYKCYVYVQHTRELKDTIQITVKEADKRAIHTFSAIIGTVSLALLFVGIGLFIRKRQLQKKIEITQMLMEVQQQNPNSQLNGRASSVHSLAAAEPALNCYSGTVNSDGTIAADTLAATFTRFTTKYSIWQKDRSKLAIKHILGEGNFGSVCLGIMPDIFYQGISSQVAVKTIKPERMNRQAITEFEKEVSIMTTLQHENIVSLVGLCTEAMPLYIIMEYMEHGQLNEFLMGKAPNKLEEAGLTKRDLLFMSLQPSHALEYLASKNIVHRDISARNCLVGDKLCVKLADFGLSRGTAVDDGKNYYKKDGGMVPVKWMAPEALNFGKYTTSNDVWSMGVLIWEIFSFGAIPYQSHSNQQVIVFVNRGGRLERPDYCPESIWKHICLCWSKEPEDRITIGGLVNMLSTELNIMDTLGENGQSSLMF